MQVTDETTDGWTELDQARHRAYSEWRKSLVEAGWDSCRAFGRAMIPLPAAALGLTLTFVRYVAPAPKAADLLLLGWAGFAISLLTILASHLASYRAMQRQIDIADEDYRTGRDPANSPSNGPSVATEALNWISLVALGVGIAFTAAFVRTNIG
jgi:hypothetical protein